MNDPAKDHEAQDDFEESLVRAVIEENPPEEQGFREEWNEHTGWHRKEDIYLRRRQDKHHHNLQQLEDANQEVPMDHKKMVDSNHTQGHEVAIHHYSMKAIVILAIMVCGVGFVLRKFPPKRRSGKKKMEDLV
mmetsp:Transcript_15557/g.32868  ORF Transcript_15557/g.32868 Transcript_15557/m.32868 type:complete len:133 (+) Transcript_15557:120-518(+)